MTTAAIAKTTKICSLCALVRRHSLPHWYLRPCHPKQREHIFQSKQGNRARATLTQVRVCPYVRDTSEVVLLESVNAN